MRVLVVDDNPMLLELYETWLRRVGHEAVTAHNGAEAVQSLPADAVVLDLTLDKGESGIDVFATLRDVDPDVPIIFATASVDEAMVRRLRALRRTRVIRKPFVRADLLQALDDA